jgi:F-box protein 18 (helicase)
LSIETNFTKEQDDIIEASSQMKCGDVMIVNAKAGCGKTTTLNAVAERNINDRFLYLAFNKAIVEESRSKFPINTKVRTLHSLAKSFDNKDIQKLDAKLIAKLLDLDLSQKNDFFLSLNILKAYNKFCNSIYTIEQISSLKLEYSNELKLDLETNTNKSDSQIAWLVQSQSNAFDYVLRLYKKIENSNFTTFENMLKNFIENVKDSSLSFDYIVVDEAQDISKLVSLFIINIAISKKYKIIIVKDDYQKIYGFLGNINLENSIIKSVDKKNINYKKLTHSFRFAKNSHIQKLTNIVLSKDNEYMYGASKKEYNKKDSTIAYLSRNNFSLLSMCIYKISQKEDYFLYGGLENFNIQEVEDAFLLYAFTFGIISKDSSKFKNQTLEEQIQTLNSIIKQKKLKLPNIKTDFLKSFNSFLELFEFAKRGVVSKLLELISIVVFIDKKSKDIINIKKCSYEKLVSSFFEIIMEYSNIDSKCVISTIHKSKGLEYDEVVVLKNSFNTYSEYQVKFNVKQQDDGIVLGFNENDTDTIESFEKILLSFSKKVIKDKKISSQTIKSNAKIHLNIKSKVFMEVSNLEKSNEEYNILYVAITRAKHKISISNANYNETLNFLKFILDNKKELSNISKDNKSHLIKKVGVLTILDKKYPINAIIFNSKYILVEDVKKVFKYFFK